MVRSAKKTTSKRAAMTLKGKLCERGEETIMLDMAWCLKNVRVLCVGCGARCGVFQPRGSAFYDSSADEWTNENSPTINAPMKIENFANGPMKIRQRSTHQWECKNLWMHRVCVVLIISQGLSSLCLIKDHYYLRNYRAQLLYFYTFNNQTMVNLSRDCERLTRMASAQTE